MRPLTLSDVRKVVVIGAHCDDIEIAAGGLLLSLPLGVCVTYVICSGTPDRQAESRNAALAFLPDATVDFSLHDLPDGRLPAHWNQTKEIIESVSTPDTDLVLSPWKGDAHQDHRLLGELVPTAFRNALHLQYEIPKWDGDLGQPSLYVPLSEEVAARKVELLDKCFPSQHGRDWWTQETFYSLMRLRGMECRSRYAEAFHVTKMAMSLR